jgi:nicotinate phosphoribosyltransferase
MAQSGGRDQEPPEQVSPTGPSRVLMMDLYELTMAQAFWSAGMAELPSTFSLFTRSLPTRRGYLVAAGLEDCLSWLEGFSFGPRELGSLEELGVFPDRFLDWLGGLRFQGDVRAVAEGTVVFPDEPILEVDAPLAVAQMAETYLLNQATLQTTLATKVSRCRQAARGRPLAEFGLRHAQGLDAGMKVARVCRLVGVGATSNVAGALEYGLEVSGTMAHSFVQAHEDEVSALRNLAESLGTRATLLVDTYNAERGIAAAVQVASEMRRRGVEVAAIRLDSGDLDQLSRLARRALDAAGLFTVKVIVTGGLDEYRIDQLTAGPDPAPIDSFGVGSAMVVSADAPLTDTVYKLVSCDGRPVRKTSAGKVTLPGPKQVWRAPEFAGDVLALRDEPAPSEAHRPLLELVMRGGQRTEAGRRSLGESSSHHATQIAGLPADLADLDTPGPFPLRLSPGLEALVTQMDRLPV